MTAWLSDTLLATSALMLLVLAAREPVRRHFGAPAAYALWLLPAARMLMPPISRTVERLIPAAPSVQLEPMTLVSVAPPAAVRGAALRDVSLIEQLGGWSQILIAIWAIGAILFLAVGVLRYQRQRRAALDGAVQLARLGSIRMVRSTAVRGPIAFGILDRVIAVPDDFEHRFDEAQRRLALDHELSHHRSGDLFANHFAFVLLSLQWFNPLAWLSHGAFRFDQEAACDCRILDKAGPRDRVDYGRAIAKAASGRALLFASALDQKKTLHRRLKSMLTNPAPGRRMAGKLIVAGALAVVLPLTATQAIEYVDIAAPAPPVSPVPLAAPLAAPLAPVAPLAPLTPAAMQIAPVAPIAPVPPVPPVPAIAPSAHSMVTIDGHQRKWSNLTPQEKASIRAAMEQARRELANSLNQNRGQVRVALAEARAELAANRIDMQRELKGARQEVQQAMREIDANAAELRRHGQDPEALKATVRASLKAVEAIDIEAITRQALASVDPALIERSLAAADEGIKRAQAAIEAADRGDEDQD
jgi:bla regulator protein BlaR1